MGRSHLRYICSLVHSCSIADLMKELELMPSLKEGWCQRDHTPCRSLCLGVSGYDVHRDLLTGKSYSQFRMLLIKHGLLFLVSQSPRIGRVSQEKNASQQTFHLNLSPFYDVLYDIKANMTSFRKQTVRSSRVSLMSFNPYHILETESGWR